MYSSLIWCIRKSKPPSRQWIFCCGQGSVPSSRTTHRTRIWNFLDFSGTTSNPSARFLGSKNLLFIHSIHIALPQIHIYRSFLHFLHTPPPFFWLIQIIKFLLYYYIFFIIIFLFHVLRHRNKFSFSWRDKQSICHVYLCIYFTMSWLL